MKYLKSGNKYVKTEKITKKEWYLEIGFTLYMSFLFSIVLIYLLISIEHALETNNVLFMLPIIIAMTAILIGIFLVVLLSIRHLYLMKTAIILDPYPVGWEVQAQLQHIDVCGTLFNYQDFDRTNIEDKELPSEITFEIKGDKDGK